MTQTTAVGTFADLGISPKLVGILEYHKFTQPTPIQAKAIPVGLTGADLIGIAQTGTGKTLGFGLPMIQRLAESKGRGLVIVPTRELALQVEESLRKIGSSIGLKTAVLIGGASMFNQIRDLKKGPHIVIATPGRLVDHISRRTVVMHHFSVVVLDEADRMFDIGFAPQVKEIMNALPPERQTMLFSATMPEAIVDLTARYMKNPARIEVAPQGTASEKVDQSGYVIPQQKKQDLLGHLLAEHKGSVLVFSRTKSNAKRLMFSLRDLGHTAVDMHADRTLAQRKDALHGFKTGRYRVLVATDIAARGIDVKDISLVINYDLPDAAEDYVHRIGRTGRAGSEGKAVSFVTPADKMTLKQIQKLIRKELPMVHVPGMTVDMPQDDRGSFGRPGGFGRRRSGGNRRFGDRKPFGGNRFERSDRPQGERSFGERTEHAGNRRHGDGPLTDRPFKGGFKKRADHNKGFAKKRSFDRV